MAKPAAEKRQLQFEDLDAIMTEVRSLHEAGYTSHGNWTLAQTCGHLSDWLRFPIDGYPEQPIIMRIIIWMMRITIGNKFKRKVLTEGFQNGSPTMPETVPAPDAQPDQQAIDQLQETIDRVQAHQGDILPSPLFGSWDRETMLKIKLCHAEHHLGFLEPK